MTDTTGHPAGMGVKLTNKITLCEDRHCPSVWETDDPDVIAVQGTMIDYDDLPEDMPMHEEVVLVPRAVLEAWAASR